MSLYKKKRLLTFSSSIIKLYLFILDAVSLNIFYIYIKSFEYSMKMILTFFSYSCQHSYINIILQ